MAAHTETWRKLTLVDGALTLTVLPGIGGRLWDVELNGHSILFQNPDLIGQTVDLTCLDKLPSRSPQFSFPLWGGEKTWIAPDSDWPDGAPHPILDSGPYEPLMQSGSSITMISNTCSYSGLKIMREITLESSSSWCIRHHVWNTGPSPRSVGIWSVMMLNAPSQIGVMTDLPTIKPVFGNENGMVTIRRRGVISDCDIRREFKIALPNSTGRTLIRTANPETWMVCRTSPPLESDQFAHGAPFEIFNSGEYNYCEAEWHAPSKILPSGAHTAFEQVFYIWRGSRPPAEIELNEAERELMECMFS